MDPVTQVLLGAAAAQATMGRRLGRAAALPGAIGGELPDVDVLLQPWSDPALPFEMHRHFTHALAFVPLGGALAAAPLLLVPALRRQAPAVVAAAMIGGATHGLIDTCTSYGTHLLWPFDAGRLAWDVISIIDPLFTLVLLAGVTTALWRASPRPAMIALVLALAYLGAGAMQHARAAAVQRQIAAARGHEIEHARVMPTLGNLVLWRSIYRHDGRIYADAVRTSWLAPPRVRLGTSRPVFTAAELPAGGLDADHQRDVFERFRRFADGFTAVVDAVGDGRATMVGDLRYALHPAGFHPIRGLRIDPTDPARPLRWVGLAQARDVAVRDMLAELVRPGPHEAPLDAAILEATLSGAARGHGGR